MKKFWSFTLMAVLITTLIAGCGKDKPEETSVAESKAAVESQKEEKEKPKEEQKEGDNSPYKIACIAPLTGSAEEHGKSYKNAIEYKLAEINAAGGINGHQIECDFYDDKGDSKESVTVASLVAENDEYLACFGPFSSTCAIAAAPTFIESGITLFAPSSSHEDFTNLGEYMVRGCNTSEIQQRFYAKFMYNFYGAKNVVFLYLNDDAGNSSKDYFQQFFEELGGSVLSAESYEKEQKDFNALLTNAKALDPEVLVVYGGYSDVASIILQAKNLEIEAPVMTFGAAQQQGLLDIVGTEGDGTLIMTALDLDADTPQLKAFSEGFMKEYNVESINSHVLNMYDGITCFADALTACGPDRAAIAEYMRNCTVEGLCGSYEVVDGDPDKPMGVVTIQDGQFVPYRTVNPDYTGDVD